MAIDSVWLGPLIAYQMYGTWIGAPAEPGAMALCFAFDSTTGDMLRDQDGNAIQVAATVEATATDFTDTTDLRARLVAEAAIQFISAGALPPGTTLNPIWTDYTPPPSP